MGKEIQRKRERGKTQKKGVKMDKKRKSLKGRNGKRGKEYDI